MSTALDIIKRSMRLIHVLDADEEPTAAEAQDALVTLNEMLDSWSVDSPYIFAIQEDDISWPGNQQSRTVGATGDFVITRPTKLVKSTYYSDANGNDYLLELLFTRAGYTAIVDKETSSDLPQVMFYEPTFPNGTLYIWPTPDSAITIHLHSWAQLTQFAALTTTFSFPPGNQQAITTSLAEELAPEFGVATPPEVSKSAFKARTRLKRINRRTPIAQVETAALHEGRSFNVFVGD